VPALEQRLAQTTYAEQLINDTTRVADIASRVAAKVDRYIAALDRLAAAAIAAAEEKSATQSILPCCSAAGPSLQPAHHWRPSRSFGGLTINRAASCELASNWSSSTSSPPSLFASNNSLFRQIVAACGKQKFWNTYTSFYCKVYSIIFFSFHLKG
jgi:hypothetical protein